MFGELSFALYFDDGAWNGDKGKISVFDNIFVEKPEKEEKVVTKESLTRLFIQSMV